MTKVNFLLAALVVSASSLLPLSTASAADINQNVAKAYNDGIVRCSNAECAKYLYACFRTYGKTTLQEFLVCGAQAARLNQDQKVVATPVGSG